MQRGGFGDLIPLNILGCMQARYGIPSAQEEEDALGWLELPMDRNDQQEVMMLAIEQVQLFFLTYPEGGHRMTDAQLIRQRYKEATRMCPTLWQGARYLE